MNNLYQRLSVFAASSCNLNCKYCIEKDCKMEPISHPQGYLKYINKVKSLNPNNRDTITSIELWGGEPLIGLDDFIFYLSDFYREFPNINTIQISTNFTLPNSAELINTLSAHLHTFNPEARIKLQISIDGPQWINDFNRGEGTTQKILNNVALLDMQYNNIDIVTNSVLYTKGLYGIISYELMEGWFNFFLNNFPTDVKFGLFRFEKKDTPFTDEDGARAAQLLAWADQWRTQNPAAASRFIWPDYKPYTLSICSAVAPNGLLALSPSCEQAICHQAIWEGYDRLNVSQINFSAISQALMNNYPNFKDNITLEDFKESLSIYTSIMWCPLRAANPSDAMSMGDFSIDATFMYAMPLYYNGAMNILLKWSRNYGQS